ncbi:MAG: hypothetical protein QM656_04710 [Paracoccaceae bacterium]
MIHVEPTGRYAEDCKIGAATFHEVVRSAGDNPIPLTRAIQSMIDKGRVSGVEVGFLHALSETIISGSATRT